MDRLAEIKAAAEALPQDQKTELLAFLTKLTHSTDQALTKARLVKGPENTLLLEAPPNAPPMTTEIVKQILADFP